jgi:hypothetical protein
MKFTCEIRGIGISWLKNLGKEFFCGDEKVI